MVTLDKCWLSTVTTVWTISWEDLKLVIIFQEWQYFRVGLTVHWFKVVVVLTKQTAGFFKLFVTKFLQIQPKSTTSVKSFCAWVQVFSILTQQGSIQLRFVLYPSAIPVKKITTFIFKYCCNFMQKNQKRSLN